MSGSLFIVIVSFPLTTGYAMDNKPETAPAPQPQKEQEQQPQWFDGMMKIIQDVLDFNMHTYKKNKVARL